MYNTAQQKIVHLTQLLQIKSEQTDLLLTTMLMVCQDSTMTAEQIRAAAEAVICQAFPHD